MIRTEPTRGFGGVPRNARGFGGVPRNEHLGRAKSLIAGGFALLAFVFALAAGTAGAPALGGLSWVMVTAGAAGIVYVGGAVIVAAFVDLRARSHHGLRPAVVSHRGDTRRSTGR